MKNPHSNRGPQCGSQRCSSLRSVTGVCRLMEYQVSVIVFHYLSYTKATCYVNLSFSGTPWSGWTYYLYAQILRRLETMLPGCFLFGFLGLAIGSAGFEKSCVVSMGAACPPEWSRWEDKCYRATGRLTWHQAKQECIQMGSVLVVPQSREETDFLLSFVDMTFWIDCNDLEREG